MCIVGKVYFYYRHTCNKKRLNCKGLNKYNSKINDMSEEGKLMCSEFLHSMMIDNTIHNILLFPL